MFGWCKYVGVLFVLVECVCYDVDVDVCCVVVGVFGFVIDVVVLFVLFDVLYDIVWCVCEESVNMFGKLWVFVFDVYVM